MPSRHPTHRLEDRSRRRFEALLPDAWVVRSKHPDYGVDLEVEIFREDGTATGLSFNVQLRATADLKKSRSTRMKVEQMAYFEALDVPTAIVRYCEPTDDFHWCWHFDRPQHDGPPRGKSVAINFLDIDRWTLGTAALIDGTLTLKRRIANLTPGGRVSLKRPEAVSDLHQSFAIEGAVDRVTRGLRWLDEPDADEDPMLILSGPSASGALEIQASGLAATVIDTPVSDPTVLAGQLIYSLIDLFRKLGLSAHAAELARLALDDQAIHTDRDLAAQACLALIDDPMAMIRLATLNQLLTLQDPAYFILVVAIIGQAPVGPARLEAGAVLFEQSAIFARDQGDAYAEASARYSLGNFYANCHEPRLALRSFRSALKLWPAYIERPYFRTELADVLFCLGRYQLAVRLYRGLPDAESLPFQWRLANALFFGGEVGEAAERYHAIKEHDQPLDRLMECEVKSWVSDWMVRRHGNRAPNARAEADRLLVSMKDGEDNIALFETIISSVDAFYCLANFNVAIKRAGYKAYEDAWAGFMICALIVPNDVDAWVNGLMCAVNIREPEICIATLNVASHLGGPSVYEHFRVAMLAQGHPLEAVSAFDHMARSLKPAKAKDDRALTLRMNMPPHHSPSSDAAI